jgi:WD40 repeat protein/DNA-binding MarR family transcriptional regulator
MNIEDAIATLDSILQPEHLNDIQELVFRQCWEGRTYMEIAEDSSYDAGYIKDVGSKLWQFLSQILGEKVTKSNVQSVLRRHHQRLQSSNPPPPPSPEDRGGRENREEDRETLPPPQHPTPPLHCDWGEAIDVTTFYGRVEELTTLKHWIVADRCRLISLLGMGGIGKTSLSIKLAEQLQGSFEYLIWRSLRNAPPINALLLDLLKFLSNGQETELTLPESFDGKLNRLMDYLRRSRCLLVLDNVETILQGGGSAGSTREGYEGYGTLFKRIGESRLESCLILTSREKPKELIPLEGEALPVRSLLLPGLTGTAGQEILKAKGALSGSDAEWASLVDRYAGNPLALKMVATTIRELFDGDIAEFLEHGTAVFDDIRALLDQQFERLTPLERKVMFWLAIAREPVSLSELQDDIVPAVPKAQLLEAIGSLSRRSLIEKREATYTQQPVVMEYLTQQLVEQMYQEIASTEVSLLIDHALIKALAKDHVRESQSRVILAAVSDRLLAELRSKQQVEQQLNQILHKLHDEFPAVPGYASGNLINLFRHLNTNLDGYDFSNLAVWQAYLQDVNLHHVNFAQANLAKSVFAQTLGSILAIAFSPNGKLLAASDADGRIRWWQMSDGQQLFVCQEHTSWVWSVTFSPDSKTLVSSGEDRTIRFWDVKTGRCTQILEGHDNWVWSVALSPDGTLLASSSEDATVKLWDVNSGHCIHTLTGHTGGVCRVIFSTDGQTIASGGVDQTIRLWDTQTGECLRVLSGHTNRIFALAYSPTEPLLVSSGDDHTVQLWNTKTGQWLRTLPHTSRIWAIAFSPDGQRLATGSDDHTVRLWDIKTGLCIQTLHGHTSRVWTVAFSPDGQLLATGSDDQTIRFWDVPTAQCVRTFQGHHNWVWSIAYHPNGSLLASGSEDRKVRLWDMETSKCIKELSGHTGRIWSVAFSPEGQMLASSSDDQTIKLWDPSTGRCLKTLRGHTRQIRMVVFSPNGILLASSSGDQTIKVWDISTGQCLKTLVGHTSWVFAAVFSPDNQWLVSGSDDKTLRLWDLQTGEISHVFQGHEASIAAVAVSSDGEFVASGSWDTTVRLWNVTTGQCRKVFEGHEGRISSVAFSPDGTILASSSSDRTTKLWSVKTGQCLATLHGHTNWVQAVAFAPNGRSLATGSEDETIKLWDIDSYECLKTLRVKRPYEDMNITDAVGITDAQKATLKALGAIED